VIARGATTCIGKRICKQPVGTHLRAEGGGPARPAGDRREPRRRRGQHRFAVRARSPADGYTLLNGASALTIAPALSRNLGYDVAKDFAPVGLTAISSFVLAVHPSVPATSIRELLVLARKRPGGLNYASSGVGAPPHLAGELLKTMAGVDILHVPYKGVGQSIGDLVGGQVVNRLNGALAAAEKMPDLRERLVSQGMDPAHTTPAAFAVLIRSELAKFAGIVERAKIPPE
jgi:tripartite-type tricarboxylate transporter receptor subunit TctC